MHDLENALSHCYLYTSDYATLRPRLDLALQQADTTRDDLAASTAWSLLGMWHHYQAIELDRAERATLDLTAEEGCFRRALELAGSRTGSEELRARALFGLGLVEQILRNDVESSAPRFEEAHELLTRSGSGATLLHSEVVRHMGFDRHLRLNDAAAGIEYLTLSLQMRETLEEQGWLASGHAALAFVMIAAGQLEAAVEHAERGVSISRTLRLAQPRVAFAQRILDQAYEAHDAHAPSAHG